MARPQTITVSGNAQISTAQSKFGPSSALFDGTGDKVTVTSSTDFAFGTGDFTAEAFIYRSVLGTHCIFDFRSASAGNNGILLFSSNTLQYYVNGAVRISVSVAGTVGAWTHIALVRSAGTTTLYANGNPVGTPYVDSYSYITSTVTIGSYYNNTAYFNGYIDEVRVSNTARYTGNFTSPTSPFITDANTLLLVHADGTNASTNFVDDTSLPGATQEDTDDLYVADGYVTDSYFVYTANAQSTVNSNFTVAATVGVIKSASMALAATFTQSATISHIEGADLQAFTDAALSAQATVIKSTNVTLNSQVTFAATVNRIITFDSAEAATATVVADPTRVRYMEAAVSAAFSLAADATKIPGGTTVTCTGDLTSEFTVYCDFKRKRNTVATLAEVHFDVTANVDRIRGFDSALASTANVNCTITKISQISAALASTANVSCAINKITQVSAALASTATVSTTASRTRALQAATNSAFTLAADVTDQTISVSAALASSSTLTASGNKTLTAQAALASTATVSAIVYDINERPIQLYYNTGADPLSPLTTDYYSTSQKKYGTGSLYVQDGTQVFAGWTKSPYSNLLDIASSQDFILRFWIRLGGTNTAVSQTLITAGSGTSLWNFQTTNTAGSVYLGFRTGTSQGNVLLSVYTGNTLDSGWNLVEVKRSGSTLTMNVTDANGTTRTDTDTYSGALSANYIQINPGQSGVDLYLDEFFFARGTNTVTNWAGTANASEIADGGLDTTVFLYHFNGTNTFYVDDQTGVKNLSAALTSQATLSASAGQIESAAANLTANASLTATAGRIQQASATLSSQGFAVTAVGRIRAETANLDSAFTVSAEITRIKDFAANLATTVTLAADVTEQTINGAASLTTTATLTADANVFVGNQIALQVQAFTLTAAGRIRAELADLAVNTTLAAQAELVLVGQANLQSTASLTANVTEQTIQAQASLTAQAQVTATVDKFAGNQATLTANTTLTAVNQRVRFALADPAAAFSLTATAGRIHAATAGPTATSGLTVSVTRIKQLAAQIDSTASELVIINKIGATPIDCAVTATVTAQAQVIQGQQALLTSTANLALTVTRIRPGVISAASQTSVLAQATTDKDAQAQLTATTVLTAQAVEVNVFAGTLFNTVQLTAAITKTTGYSAGLTTTAEVNCSIQRIRLNQSLLNSTATITLLGGKIVAGQANLSCQGFVLSTGTILHIEPDLTYLVPRESRTYKILNENREFMIDYEERTYIIQGH